MELKREEIVKALECCTNCNCDVCPYVPEQGTHKGTIGCNDELMINAISLINELTEENERLMDECGNQSTLWRQHFESIYETAKGTVIADTVKKMQKEIEARCIKGGIYPAFVRSTIEQIAEEMIGGNNGNKED